MNNIIDSRQRGLWGSTWGFFIGFAAVTLFAPLSNYLALSPVQTALLLGISSLTGSLLRIPFAAWCDTTGGKKPMLVLLCIATLGVFGISLILENSVERIRELLPLLLFFGAMAGCGIATFSVGVGQTAYWFPKREQGKALGLYAGIGGVAPGLFVYFITNHLIETIGYRWTYWLWTAFLAFGTVCYAVWAKNAWYFQLRSNGIQKDTAIKVATETYGQEVFPTGSVVQSLKKSIVIWQVWILISAYFVCFGGYLALTNWFKELFTNFHGLTEAQAGLWASVYSIGAALSRAASGTVTDRIGGRSAARLSMAITCTGAVLIALTRSYNTHIAGLFIMMLGMGAANASVFKMVPIFAPESVGGAAGWVGGLGAFGGFLIPLVLARLLTEGQHPDIGYTTGFFVFAGLALFVLIALNFLPKK